MGPRRGVLKEKGHAGSMDSDTVGLKESDLVNMGSLHTKSRTNTQPAYLKIQVATAT